MNESKVTVYMIGNAHIDPVWLWRWQEGFAEVLSTCRSALDRMKECPDFVFTRADAATYEWIESACPAMFEEIRARVKEGRWSIVGGWWEQPDCNIPSGESFVRHELYGKRYFLEKFGVDVNVGYNVDSFGHNAGLPQILSKAGIGCYVFMRPDKGEKDLPDSAFWWEGPDGSKVLAFRLHRPYGVDRRRLPEQVPACVENRPHGTDVAACFFGVGNHGGGPTIEAIEYIKKLQSDPDAPNLVFGTIGQMFEHLLAERSDFPTVRGDLQHHAVGCYTAHSEVKALNRRAESALTIAEKFCALAKLANGGAFPKARFAEAWQRLLFNQFHDILAGTSIPEAYEDVRNAVGATIDAAEHETTVALSAIAWGVETLGEGRAFLAFNPHAFPMRCPVYFDGNEKALTDHTGRRVPVQAAVPFFQHTGSRAKKVFVDCLPPLGYRLYYAGNWEEGGEESRSLRATGDLLENDFYQVRIDPESGEIGQIADLRAGTDVLSAPAGAVVIEDPSDTWSHGVVSYDEIAGRFGDARIEIVEAGPVRATLRVRCRFGESTLWQDISLYHDLPIIEFRITIDWREKHRVLKFEFPLALKDPVATYEAAYAVVTHPADGAENPGQRWMDVTGTRDGMGCYGVSLVNDGKYGFDVRGSTMRLTAVRSPIYAFHDPRKVEPDKRYRYMDQGLQSFAFAILPHRGGWQDAGTVLAALAMNMPPVVVETFAHAGKWPGEQSFCQVSEPNVEMCAMKEAEDGAAFIVRLYETAGKATEARLNLMDAVYPVEMGPFELKTLKIEGGMAAEVDLIERPLQR